MDLLAWYSPERCFEWPDLMTGAQEDPTGKFNYQAFRPGPRPWGSRAASGQFTRLMGLSNFCLSSPVSISRVGRRIHKETGDLCYVF